MNYLILLVNTILGLLLLYSYYFLINKTNDSQRLWGRIHKKYRPFYTISMILAALGYMFMIYFLGFKVKNNKPGYSRAKNSEVLWSYLQWQTMPIPNHTH